MTFSQSESPGDAELQGEELKLMAHMSEPSGVLSLAGTTVEGHEDPDTIGHCF